MLKSEVVICSSAQLITLHYKRITNGDSKKHFLNECMSLAEHKGENYDKAHRKPYHAITHGQLHCQQK